MEERQLLTNWRERVSALLASKVRLHTPLIVEHLSGCFLASAK